MLSAVTDFANVVHGIAPTTTPDSVPSTPTFTDRPEHHAGVFTHRLHVNVRCSGLPCAAAGPATAAYHTVCPAANAASAHGAQGLQCLHAQDFWWNGPWVHLPFWELIPDPEPSPSLPGMRNEVRVLRSGGPQNKNVQHVGPGKLGPSVMFCGRKHVVTGRFVATNHTGFDVDRIHSVT